MPLVTVRFDRIFDVVHGTLHRKSVTFFGFECGSTKRYGVPGPGHIEPRQGAIVTALLRKANNWQTLVGWLDHETGEVVVEQNHYEISSLVWCLAALAFLAYTHGHQPIAASVAMGFVIAWATWCVASLRRLQQARSLLESLRGDAPPAVASAGDA